MIISKDGFIQECSIPFKLDLIPESNTTSYPDVDIIPRSLTIHNTGNKGASAQANSDYVDETEGYVSWHFTVGNNIVIQEMSIYKKAWHAGDGKYGTGNCTSIGIEIAEVDGAYETAVKFIVELLDFLGWGVDNHIFPHKHWSGKYCPRLILPIWDSEFIPSIKHELEEINKDDDMKLIEEKGKANIYGKDVEYTVYYTDEKRDKQYISIRELFTNLGDLVEWSEEEGTVIKRK